ncbi:hypothetical protein EVAR_102176_1 [Eumeta japonica]|uniref:Uncharacterized protein n=1 Tax=Eumeta variegata TaxID=151549 RepID=A0A4C1ZGI7_EUMVA|nr:hypothetical protein EVAR_102176_1 [Eumeta japonica]
MDLIPISEPESPDVVPNTDQIPILVTLFDSVSVPIFDHSRVHNFSPGFVYDSDPDGIFDSALRAVFNSNSATNNSCDLNEIGGSEPGIDEKSFISDLFRPQPTLITVDGLSHLKAFQNKISLWEAQTLSGNSYHFTTLSAYENIAYAKDAEEFK